MLLIFLDTETTGLDSRKHRIIEIAFEILDSSTHKSICRYQNIIAQPQEIWAEADPYSLEINGFSWEDSLKGKPEKVIAQEIAELINDSGIQEKSGVFVCQNPSFDRPFFSQLIDIEMQESYRWPYHWLDLASMYWAYRLLQSPVETARLIENDLRKDLIAKHFGLPKEATPHRAMNGVEHLLLCYREMFVKDQ